MVIEANTVNADGNSGIFANMFRYQREYFEAHGRGEFDQDAIYTRMGGPAIGPVDANLVLHCQEITRTTHLPS